MSFKKIFNYGLYGIIICFSAVITIFLLLIALGYSINGIGWEVGEKAVQKNDISLCHKIIVIFNPLGLSPSAAEQRLDCILTYARIAKDPTACELLMPSSYGLSCVGGAESEPDLCSMSNGKVSWDNGEETYASCANTSKKRRKDAEACCLIARVSFVLSENDCSPIKNSLGLYNECLQNLAFKNHDPTLCTGISNNNTKNACIVNASAIRKDPSICAGCKTRVQTLSELK